jgi:hypothetical protein
MYVSGSLNDRSAKGKQMGRISRRDFGRITAEAGMASLTGTLAHCAVDTAPLPAEGPRSRTRARPRPAELTQADGFRRSKPPIRTLIPAPLRSARNGPAGA